MKIVHITTTEEMVLNLKYKGLRMARIEVWTDREEQRHVYEVGRIEIFKDDELFEAVREAIEWSSADVEPRQATHGKIRCSDTIAVPDADRS